MKEHCFCTLCIHFQQSCYPSRPFLYRPCIQQVMPHQLFQTAAAFLWIDPVHIHAIEFSICSWRTLKKRLLIMMNLHALLQLQSGTPALQLRNPRRTSRFRPAKEEFEVLSIFEFHLFLGRNCLTILCPHLMTLCRFSGKSCISPIFLKLMRPPATTKMELMNTKRPSFAW